MAFLSTTRQTRPQAEFGGEETEKPFELSKRCMNYILIRFSSSKEGGREGEYVFSVRRESAIAGGRRIRQLRMILCLRRRATRVVAPATCDATATAAVVEHPLFSLAVAVLYG